MHIHGHIHNHDHVGSWERGKRGPGQSEKDVQSATNTAAGNKSNSSANINNNTNTNTTTTNTNTTNTSSTGTSTSSHTAPEVANKATSNAVSTIASLPDESGVAGVVSCAQLDALDVCSDIFCEELDDCYFYDCERLQGLDPQACDTECCHDPSCLDEMCGDTECEDHHDNSLCELQKPRVPIFEDLIHNVQRNIEGFTESGHSKDQAEMPVHIHFPHHCHLDDPVVSNHQTHQSCFHARVPNTAAADHPTDFDFFVQFNNFDQWMDEAKLGILGDYGETRSMKEGRPDAAKTETQNSGLVLGQNMEGLLRTSSRAETLVGENLQETTFEKGLLENSLLSGGAAAGSIVKKEPDLPKDVQAALAAAEDYPCRWERCVAKVDDRSLASHVIDSHLRPEYDLNRSELPFECEWDTCNYVDSDLAEFVRHLDTHKHETGKVLSPLTPASLVPEELASHQHYPHSLGLNGSSSGERLNGQNGEVSGQTLNGQNSIDNHIEHHIEQAMHGRIHTQRGHTHGHTLHGHTLGSTTHAQTVHSHGHQDLHITAMTISPKVQDTSFTCRWQIGTSESGEPIMCNRTHASEGELQHHLQDEHIGLGKSEYRCCWVGCARNGGKVFVQRQKLLRHIHVHTHYKPCVCKVCGARFAVAAMLKQHARTHSGEKPFACTVCGKRFTTSLSLSIHHRVHSGERPLECKWPGCGKRFSESSNLAKHMRVHTKTFGCDICGEVFDKKTAYTKHRRTHGR